VAAGSASLQADALDFLGDTANYAISLIVVGMALRYRASAALAKGATMGLFGLWVIGTVIWHSVHGTLPSAFTMGAVGFAALTANAASFGLLWAYRGGDANVRSVVPATMCWEISRYCLLLLAYSAPAPDGPIDRRCDYGRTGVAGCDHCGPAIAEGTASATYCSSRVVAALAFVIKAAVQNANWRHHAQFVVTDSKNAITLARSSADVSPPYGFMLLPGTTSSGFAVKRSSFSLSHTKSASFMALE
jgi:hypothetical protein